MRITGIGINGDVDHLGGSLSQLAEDLAFFAGCGFDAVEVSVDGLDVIVGGRLQRRQVERMCHVAERFPLAYSVHPPGRLNLAFPQRDRQGAPELAMEKDVFVACLDCCAALGAKVMVYHSGLIALHEARYDLGGLPDEEALEAARLREVEALRELMPLASERGVTVAMENRDPHPWELAVLRRAGRDDRELTVYHSGLLIPALLRQLAEVNHPGLGLTVDAGHLYIAAGQCGFDYLEAVRQAAPHLRHIHAHDNCGRLGGVYTGLDARIPYGDGDLHLPPGWGTLPLAESFAHWPEYEGLVIMELQPRCREHYVEALETMRRIVAEAG